MPCACIPGKAPVMSSMPPTPIATAPITAAAGSRESVSRLVDGPALDQGVKDQIVALLRRFDVARVAAMVETNFKVTVSREQMLAVWNERHAPETQTLAAPDESRPDKESLHPVDERECLLTLPGAVAEPAPLPAAAPAEAAPSTPTGPGPEQASIPIPTAATNTPTAPRKAPPGHPAPPQTKRPPAKRGIWEKVRVRKLSGDIQDYIIDCMARHQPPTLIAKTLEESFGVCVDPEQIVVCWRDRDALPTQTGRRQEKDSRSTLSDEIKEFIVKRLACYETPSRVAAAVRNYFGVDVDRRQVFAYDPAGSRPPAQRWIDLHAATRTRFLRETAGIAVAQKVVRLRMLDRLAQTAEENNCDERFARLLAQAARECGGFYDKQPLPLPAMAPPSAG